MAGAITETIDVDAGPGIAALREFTDALEQASAKWSQFEAKMGSGLGGGGADKLAASMDEAAAAISAAADKAAASLDKIGAAGDSAGAGMERIGAAADSAGAGLERLDEAAATAGESLDAAAAAADEAAGASDRLAESADAAGAALDRQAVSGKEAGDSAAKAGAASEGGWKAAKVALLGVGVAAAYGIDKAMKFQSQMLLLNTQAGVSMPNVKKMSQGVLEISTQTGQSLTSVAESAYHVASNMESLGGTPVQMLNAVKIAAEGASVGHSNLVDTTNALTSVIASGIPGAKNYSQAMGAINATVGAGDMTMQDLSEAMATGVVPVVKGYGLTLKDTGAALATYGDLNIRGAKAGTELRMAVQALAVPAAAGKAELASLGLTTNSLSKDMESGGLGKALDDLNTRFEKNGITAKNMGGVITDIFGKKAGAGLSLLMENLDRFQSKYPALTKGANDFNAAWEKTQATPQQKWKELTAGLQASAVNFGTSLLPAFSTAVGFADRILGDINGTKGAADALAIGFGGLAALFTGKKLVSGVEDAFKTGETVLRGIGKIGSVLNIPGADKLATLGQGSQASGAAALDGSAARLDGAAEALTGAAEKLAGEGGLGGAAGKAEGAAGAEGATAAEAGGAGSLLTAAKAALGPVSLGVILGSVIKGIGDQIAPAGSTAGKYNAMLQKTPSTNDSSMMPYIFGGFEGKLMSSIGPAVGGAINNAIHFASGSFDASRHAVASAGNFVAGSYDSTSHAVASAGHDVASFLGFGGGSAPAAPAQVSGRENLLGAGGHPGTVSMGTVNTSALDAAKGKIQADINAINATIAGAKAKDIKIPAPDLSALDTAKAKLQSDMDGIKTELAAATGKPSKIAAPDLSQVDAAKSKALADATAIMTGLQSTLSRQVHAAAPDLSAYVAARGAAQADGANIDAGLAAGITSNAGVAIAAAHQVAAEVSAAMAAALQTKSPSKVTETIGEAFSEGFAKGIKEKDSAPKAAAVSLSASTLTSLTSGLQGGSDAINAALQAISGKGSRPQDITNIINTISTLKDDVSKALADKQITRSQDSALVKMLTADNAKLQALSTQRTMLEAEITDATQITQAAVSGASIMTAGAATPYDPSTTQSAYSLIQGQQYQAQQAKQFAQAIAQDKKLGLNATSLNQIIQSGAASGLPVAQGIAQGGKSAVTQLNALQSQIQSSAAKLGNEGAGPMYQAGVDAGQGVAAGIKSQLGAVDAAIKQMADSMVAEMKKDLKSHSPSLVFADVGMSIPQGVALGVDAGTPVAQAAVGRMGSRLSGVHPGITYGHDGGFAGGGGSGGSGGGHTTINVTVQGSVTTENDLLTKLQGLQLKRANNNWQGGWQLPGRKT